MKNFIVCDGDQTLYRGVHEPISNKMLETIQNITDCGYSFGVISGTSEIELTRLIRSQEIGRSHHILANSGSIYSIYDRDNLKNKYKFELNEEDKEEIICALTRFTQEIGLEPVTSKEDQIQDRGSQITLSALGRKAPQHLKDAYDPTKAIRMRHVEILKTYLLEGKYNLGVGGTTSIDVTDIMINKGWGLRKFVENNHGSTLEDITFLGDQIYPGGNDYSVSLLPGVNCIPVKNVNDCLEKLSNILCPTLTLNA